MFILGHVYELVIGNVDEKSKCPLKADIKLSNDYNESLHNQKLGKNCRQLILTETV